MIFFLFALTKEGRHDLFINMLFYHVSPASLVCSGLLNLSIKNYYFKLFIRPKLNFRAMS